MPSAATASTSTSAVLPLPPLLPPPPPPLLVLAAGPATMATSTSMTTTTATTITTTTVAPAQRTASRANSESSSMSGRSAIPSSARSMTSAAQTTSAASSTMRGPALFDVSLGPRVDLDQVYWNGLHALRRFELRSRSALPLLIKLRSNLGGQIVFQLSNENLPDTDDTLQPPPPPTYAAVVAGTSGTSPRMLSGFRGPALRSAGNSDMSLATSMSFISTAGSSSESLFSDLGAAARSAGPTDSRDGTNPTNIANRVRAFGASGSSFTSSNASCDSLPSSGSYVSLGSREGDQIGTPPPPRLCPVLTGDPAGATTSDLPGPIMDLDSNSSRSGGGKSSVHQHQHHHRHRHHDGGHGMQVSPVTPVPRFSTTNTATAAALGAFGGAAAAAVEFNQLFNFVGHVDEIKLAPFESRKLILGFLPAPPEPVASAPVPVAPPRLRTTGSSGNDVATGNGRGGQMGAASPFSDGSGVPAGATGDVSTTDNDDSGETFEFTDVSGLVMFYGYALATDVPPPAAADTAADAATPLTGVSTTGTTSITSSGIGAKADSSVVVKLKARICKSVLATESAHHGLLFDDCVPGDTFFRDFTVWNKSEIDLYWSLNKADISHALTFTEYNSGEPLDQSKPIPAYSYCHVRVMYKPEQLGDFDYEIQLENANDSSNVEIIRVQCVVRSAVQDDALVVLSGQSLDFGDVVAGMGSTTHMVIKNVTEAPLDVRFAVEGVPAGSVVFNIAHHAGTQDTLPTPFGADMTAEVHRRMRGLTPPQLDDDAMVLHGPPVTRGLSSSSEPLSAALTTRSGPNNGGGSLAYPTSTTGSGGGGGGGGGSGVYPREGEFFAPLLRSSGSSRASSPMPSRSVSVEMALSDLAREVAAAPNVSFGQPGSFGTAPPSSLQPAGGATGQRLSRAAHAGVAIDDEDSDSESMASVRSLHSTGSAVGSGLGGAGTNSVTGLSSASAPGMGSLTAGSAPHDFTGLRNLSTTSPAPGDLLIGAAGMRNGGGNGARSSKHPEPQYIEEITLRPGAERTIAVSYRPEKAHSASDFNASTLVKRNFRVILQHKQRERKVIQCKARACTSFIAISPPIVAFGDTDVGQLKSAPVRITNLSEVPARVELSFASKVLSCHRDELRILPRQSVEVKIDIYPRKVNPDYRKQITVINAFNRDNDQIIEVRSTNIDKQRITWHSFFYRVMTPSSANFIDYGAVVSNHYGLRSFSVQNVSLSPLALNITSSSLDTISLYIKRKVTGAKVPDMAAKKLVLGSIADRRIKRANSEMLPAPTTGTTPAYLDLAVPHKSVAAKTVSTGSADPSTPVNSVDEVVTILQHLNISTLPAFTPQQEPKFVKLIMALRKSLDAVIRSGDLMPISPRELLRVPPGTELEFVALLQAPSVKERRKKLDARLLFSLVEFDSSLLPTAQTVLPVREFLVRCVVCPSILDVGQRNISFGNVELQASMSKTIVVRNKSDVPLLYAVKKTGSIASGDILLDSRFGVIPPFGSREVTFTFQPSMAGAFHEKITVENVMNPESSQVITLKATVRKPEAFSIHTESLDFGVCLVNEPSTACVLTLHNTHRSARTFTVRGDDNNDQLQWEFSVVGTATMEQGMQDVEERIETLEQKLKIAKRKGHKEKVDKITETISKLRRGTETIVSTSKDGAGGDAGDSSAPAAALSDAAAAAAAVMTAPTTTALSSKATPPPPAKDKDERKFGFLTLPVDPFAIVRISVSVRPKPAAALARSVEDSSSINAVAFSGFLYIHHHKNTDLLKKVAYSVIACFDQPSYIAALEGHVSMETAPHKMHSGVLTSAPLHQEDLALADMSSGAPGSTAAAASTASAAAPTPPPTDRSTISTPTTPLRIGTGTAFPLLGPGARAGSMAGLQLHSSTSSRTPSISIAARNEMASPEELVRLSGSPTLTAFESVSSAPSPVTDRGAQVQDLALETSIVDVGKFTVGQPNSFYFVLVNSGANPVPYSTTDMAVNEADRNGTLAPLERRVINAAYTPVRAGRQAHTLAIFAQGYSQLFTVNFTAVFRDGLAFYPQSTPQATPQASDMPVSFTHQQQRLPPLASNEIDLGYCYNAKRFVLRSTVLVVNTMPEPVKLSAASTLAQQVAAFADPECKMPFTDILVQPAGSTVAYLAVQPNLTQPLLSVGKKSLVTAESRQLVGGFRFGSTAVETGEEIGSQHLKFSAVIGPSVFSVSSTFINLGRVTSISQVDASFVIFNMSERMPLAYAVTPASSSDRIRILNPTGTLRGANASDTEMAAAESGSSTASRVAIQLKVTPTTFGYLSETLTVTNVHCPDQVTEIVVTLLVDPMTLSVWAPSKLPSALGEAAPTSGLPLVQWDHIYVQMDASTQPPSVAQVDVPGNERIIQFENLSATTTTVVPCSQSGIQLRCVAQSTSNGNVVLDDLALDLSVTILAGRARPCGPTVRAAAASKWSCTLSAPLPPADLTEDDIQTLQSGRNIKVRGILAFCTQQENFASMGEARAPPQLVTNVVELIGYYCLSRIEVTSVSPTAAAAAASATSTAASGAGVAGTVTTPANVSTTAAAGAAASTATSATTASALAAATAAGQAKLGPFVQVRRGERAKFSITVKNAASCPTQLAVSCPLSTVVYDGPAALSLESFAQAELEFKFDASTAASGIRESVIAIQNLTNPSNSLLVPVTFKVTALDLTLDERGDLNAGHALTLPVIPIPNLQGVPMDAWFSVTNPTADEVRFTMEPELIQALAPFVQLMVLSRFSSSPINWLTLPPGGTMEVKVKVLVKDNVKTVTDAFPLWLLDDRGIQIGQVRVENDDGKLVIPVWAQVVEQSWFEVDTTALQLRAGDPPTIFHVTNFHPSLPLVLDVQLELLHDLGVCDVDFPTTITVPPRETIEVPVQLQQAEFSDSGDSLLLHVSDLASVKQHRRSIRLRFVEPMSPTMMPSVPHSPTTGSSMPMTPAMVLAAAANGSMVAGDSSSSSQALQELLTVKGCSKQGRMYEMDLGQVDVGSATAVTRKFVIELVRPVRCSWQLRPVSAAGTEWLSLGRTEGTLDPAAGGGKSVSVSLLLSAAVRGVFSTYLVLENLDYAHDTKYIKVLYECVARASVRKARPFDLVCNGLDDSPTIAFENVFYGHEYTSRSFSIANRESVPLEFSLKLQSPTQGDPSEVLFSTSKSIPKLFKTVVVAPESAMRVYLRFRPMRSGSAFTFAGARDSISSPSPLRTTSLSPPPPLIPVTAGVAPTSAVSSAALTEQPSSSPPLQASSPFSSSSYDEEPAYFDHGGGGIVEVKEFDVVVNCRLLRDFQDTVHVTATCLEPQMRMSASDVVIRATLDPAGTLLMCDDDTRALVVSNLSTRSPLTVQAVSDLPFFSVGFTSPGDVSDAPLATDDTEVDRDGDGAEWASFPQQQLQLERLQQQKHRRRTLAPGAQCALSVQLDMEQVLRHMDSLRRDKYYQGYFVVYNRGQCHERVFVTVKIALGFLDVFTLGWWVTHRSPAFMALEARVVDFLRQVNREPSLLWASSSSAPILTGNADNAAGMTMEGTAGDSDEISVHDDLYFQYRCVIDHLVFVGTVASAPDHVIHLASLLFTGLLAHHHGGFGALSSGGGSAPVDVWLDGLRYFITFFTTAHPVLASLRSLYHSKRGASMSQLPLLLGSSENLADGGGGYDRG
ncbi:hypothetical protein BC828DRAFT_397312 [Blastocladiella britannica]|nr:hypothetical protein BC828DRAFT_397312 [Blastocladiella britannica]